METRNPVAVWFCVNDKLVIGLLWIAAMALSGGFALTYTGPYRAIAEMQLRSFGGYEPLVTWLLLAATVRRAAAHCDSHAGQSVRVEAPHSRRAA